MMQLTYLEEQCAVGGQCTLLGLSEADCLLRNSR